MNSVIIFLFQITLLRLSTFILGSLTVTLIVLLFLIYSDADYISSDTSICSTMAFPPLENSDHVVVSILIDFPTNSKCDAPFHSIVNDNSRADWCGLPDHLRDVPWGDIFRLTASAAASEFYEGVEVETDVYIPHRKHQVKPHSSPWFSATCAAAIVHRDHFFHLYQQNKYSEVQTG